MSTDLDSEGESVGSGGSLEYEHAVQEEVNACPKLSLSRLPSAEGETPHLTDAVS